MNKKLVFLGLVGVVATLIDATYGFPYFATASLGELKFAFGFTRYIAQALSEAGLPTLGFESIPRIQTVTRLSLYEGFMNGLALIAFPTVAMAGFLLLPVVAILEAIKAFKSHHYFTVALAIVLIPLVVLVAPLSLVFYTLAAAYFTLTMPSHDAQYLQALVPMSLLAAGASVGVIALGWQMLITLWGWATLPFLMIFSGGGVASGGAAESRKPASESAHRRPTSAQDGLATGGDDLAIEASGAAFRATESHARRNLLGEEYVEHYDERGNKVNESHARRNLLGEKYVEHWDERETKNVGESHTRRDLLGEEYVEHYDERGNKVSESHTRRNLLGEEYVEHYDERGNKVSESHARRGLSGEKYIEHSKDKNKN